MKLSELINDAKYYWHATSMDNLGSIMSNGIKKDRMEGVVYLADSAQNAAKFLVVRGIKEIVSLRISAKKLDPSKLSESFDHVQSFFECKAYIYEGDIPESAIDFTKSLKYEI